MKHDSIKVLFYFNQHTLAVYREAIGPEGALFGMRVRRRIDRLRNWAYLLKYLGIVVFTRSLNRKLEVYIPHTRHIMRLVVQITRAEDIILIDDGAIFLHTALLPEISQSNISRCVASSGYYWPHDLFKELVTVPRKDVYASIIQNWNFESLATFDASAILIDDGRLPLEKQVHVNQTVQEMCKRPLTCLWHPSRRERDCITGQCPMPAEAFIDRASRNIPIFGYDSTTMFNLSAAGFTKVFRLVGLNTTPISDDVFTDFGIRSIEVRL